MACVARLRRLRRMKKDYCKMRGTSGHGAPISRWTSNDHVTAPQRSLLPHDHRFVNGHHRSAYKCNTYSVTRLTTLCKRQSSSDQTSSAGASACPSPRSYQPPRVGISPQKVALHVGIHFYVDKELMVRRLRLMTMRSRGQNRDERSRSLHPILVAMHANF